MRKLVTLNAGDFSEHISLEGLTQQLSGETGFLAISVTREDGKIVKGLLEVEESANINAMKTAIKAHKVKADETDEARSERGRVDVIAKLLELELRIEALEGGGR